MYRINEFCKCDLKYRLLSVIDIKNLQQIKLVFIFSTPESNDILFITNSDDVYGFGNNFCGKLGFGHSSPVRDPMVITELCGKSIKQIETGHYFMVALTEYGDLYSWGYEAEGRLGNGRNSNKYCKPQKIDLNYLLVANVECCASKTILLTQNDQIYWFGYRQNGTMAPTPTLLDSLLDQEITDICCGGHHFLALTITGRVYSWGSNSHGQLGLGPNHSDSNREEPQIIQIHETVFIKGISCGYNHSLLLTPDGDIFSFGNNYSGQLGTGDDLERHTPTQLETSEKFIEIFAFEDMSMALSQTHKLYVWGKTKQKTFSFLYKTKFCGFQEAIDFLSEQLFTYKPLSFDDIIVKKSVNRVIETMAKAFNNPKNSDLKFKIKRKDSEEFDYIYGHKWFIEENSEHFQRMFANECSESLTNEIEINGYSYESYYHFIRYFYTDSIETEDIQVLNEMLFIANQYLDERVKSKCVQSIKPLISVENVCSFYSSALKINSEELEDFCFKFMSGHISHITDTEDYKQMDGNDIKAFFTKYSKQNQIQ